MSTDDDRAVSAPDAGASVGTHRRQGGGAIQRAGRDAAGPAVSPARVWGSHGGMLLYGDSPPSGEPTLELLRRPLPIGREATAEARAVLERTLTRWGWEAALAPAIACVTAVLDVLADHEPETIEVFALRRLRALTIEVHYLGTTTRFHQLSGEDVRRAPATVIDRCSPLWGVRPLGDGEAVWFELHLPPL